MRIKRYIEEYGLEISPAEGECLPKIYKPGSDGWITYLVAAFSSFSEYQPILSIVSEQEFQALFGSRRLRNDHKLVVNFPQAYGFTVEEAKHYLDTALIDFAEHRLPQWVRMLEAMEAEYNPIENYDRYEQSTTTHTGTDTINHGKTDTLTMAGTETDTLVKSGSETDTPSGKAITKDQSNVNGYNSDDSVPVSDGTTEISFDGRVDTHTYNNRTDTNTKAYNQRSDTRAEGGQTENVKDLEDGTDSHIHGNIGVTTAPQMINEELELRRRDLLESIYREIADRFLLSVY